MRIPNKYNGYSADNIRLYNDPVTLTAMATAASAAAPAAATTAAAALPAAPALAGQAAMAAPSAIPGLIGGASPVFSAAANPLTTAMSTGASGFPLNASIGQSVGQAAQPSFFDSFKGFAKENPMLTQMGFSTAKDMLTPEQMNPAPVIPVQSRGKLAPYDPISFMNPYQQTAISNQPISLI